MRYFISSSLNSLGILLLFIFLIINIFYDSLSERVHFFNFLPDKLEPTILAGLIGAFVVLLTLRRNFALQRAEFISRYLSQFYTNSNLWKTYHELVYGYWDKFFKQTDTNIEIEKMKEETIKRIEHPESYDGPLPPMDSKILDRNQSRTGPTYHPWLFQGSEEEGKIDALLGFLNGVDYYCAKGLIGVGEVYRHMGTHLLTLHSRGVMQSYFEINDRAWRTDPFRRDMGVEPATKPARNLLSCIKAYDNLLIVKTIPTLWQTKTTGGKSK